MHVEPKAEDLRTRVRLPPPPPNKKATLAVAFLFGESLEVEHNSAGWRTGCASVAKGRSPRATRTNKLHQPYSCQATLAVAFLFGESLEVEHNSAGWRTGCASVAKGRKPESDAD